MRLTKCFFYLLLMLSMSNAQAHQQKQAFITILFNQHTDNIEVSHRFLIHDAEHALKISLQGLSDLNSNKQSQDRFAEYIQKHFRLTDDNGDVLVLSMVGHEVEGKYFWVYQEMSISKIEELGVKHTALYEVWPSQINQINVEKDGWVRSARLTKDNSSQVISLLKSK